MKFELWYQALVYPLLNILIALTKFTGSLGWSIVVLTVGLRLAMTPLVMPSLKAGKKMQELAPELAKLKEKHKGDKQALMTAQAALYKERGLNPAAGCLPQIIQIIVLIALFNAFNSVLAPANGTSFTDHLYSFNQLPENFQLSTRFFYMDLTKPDVFNVSGIPFPLPGLFLILSAVVQLLSSKMMVPAAKKQEIVAKATEDSTDDMMAKTQEQMLYMFPLMTLIFGFQFPAGLVVYWLVFAIVSMVQQYFASGWGGLTPWLRRLKMVKS
jgi:YidC/Oxa1 family membrane protein insertase